MMPIPAKASDETVTQSSAVALTQWTLPAYPASARLSPTAIAAVTTMVTTRPAAGRRSCAANAVLAEDGQRPLSVAEYTRYLGMTDDDLWRDLRTVRDLGRPHEHYLERFDTYVLAEYRQHAIAAPGARPRAPLAVASSSRAVGRDLPLAMAATSIASSAATW